MSLSLQMFSKQPAISQECDTCVAYIEKFDLTPWTIWDEYLGVCMSTEGMQSLLSSVAKMTGKGWIYMYAAHNPHDESVIDLHYQAPLS